jgi:hypothetical protein
VEYRNSRQHNHIVIPTGAKRSHPGHDDDVGAGRFITLWQNKGDPWQVTRVISFDHRPLIK